MLHFFKTRYSKVFKHIDDSDIIIAKKHIDIELKDSILIGDKIDKKSHAGVFLKIGKSISNENVIAQQNLTSKQTINFSEECKIDSNMKYEYIKGKDIISQSYETPVIIKNSSLAELNKTNQRNFSENDIRYIIKHKLYPTTLINALTLKNNYDSMYIDDTEKHPEKIIIEKDMAILNAILKNEIQKGTIIAEPINTLNDWVDKIYQNLTTEELQAIETMYLMNSLKWEKKVIIAKVKDNLKTLKIIELEDLQTNHPLYQQIYLDQKILLQNLENTASKIMKITI